MKNPISFLILISFGILFGQEFKDFSEYEKALISSAPGTSMKVFQKSESSDSLVLKSPSIAIDPEDKLTHILAGRMLLSVMETGGVGIAAPQVGINRRMVLVQRFDKKDNPFEVFINPEIIWESELMQLGPEGDLSFEESGMVMRNYAVQIQHQIPGGEAHTELLEGFTAVIFQHERDHLDGILLIDRIEEQSSLEFIPAAEKSNVFFNSKP